jgi:alpha-beta hydrolase superfamily lysophospholipase
LYLTSEADGLRLHVLVMEPEGDIRGVVQICHGMTEHKERYEPFMRQLCRNGYAAVIHDHRGHGKSVEKKEDLGYFYDNSGTAIVEDAYQVTDILRRDTREWPCISLDIVWGHWSFDVI